MLVISHLYPLARDPALGVFVTRELLALAPLGFEFDVLVPRPWAPWPLPHIGRWRAYAGDNPVAGPAELRAREVRYPRPPGTWYRRFEGGVLGARLGAVAAELHRDHPFGLVLATSLFPDADAGRAVARAIGVPLVAMAVGSDLHAVAARVPDRLRRLLTDVDLAIGVSRELCDRLTRALPDGRAPLHVYLGRDPAQFALGDRAEARRALGWPAEGTVLVYVGALWPRKGIAELARAVAPLLARHPEARLVCLGAGAEGAALERAVAAVGRSDALLLAGSVPPDDVPRYLQASDVFVLPSHAEGMPQSVLEAMGCGLPVVATRVGGIPEAVVDGETGLLVEPGDPAALGRALERMLGDASLRERAGAAGRARALAEFDPAVHAQRLADALRRTAGLSDPPAL